MSDKNELFRSVKKHEIILRKTICELAARVLEMGGFAETEISVFFDDSIIEDTQTVSDRAIRELEHGLIDSAEYFVKVYGMTESQALSKVNEIKSRGGI